MSPHEKNRGVPDRWLDYSAVGSRLDGTRFIAFKVPLKQDLNRLLPPSEVFGPWELLEALSRQNQELGLILDLTFTTRYYSLQDVPESLQVLKIFTAGHQVPSDATILLFKRAVRAFLRDNQQNDKLIGVHCTHGVNRTGYLICRYLIDVDGMEPEGALQLFNSSRSHDVERQNYLEDLRTGPRRSNEGMDQMDPSQQPQRGRGRARHLASQSWNQDRTQDRNQDRNHSWNQDRNQDWNQDRNQDRNHSWNQDSRSFLSHHQDPLRPSGPPEWNHPDTHWRRSRYPLQDQGRSRYSPQDQGKSRYSPQDQGRSRYSLQDQGKSRYSPQDQGKSRYSPQDQGRSRYSAQDQGRSKYSPKDQGRSRYSPQDQGRSRYSLQDQGKSRYSPQDQGRSRYSAQDQGRSRYSPKDQGRSRYSPQDQSRSRCSPQDQGRSRCSPQDQGRSRSPQCGRSRTRYPPPEPGWAPACHRAPPPPFLFHPPFPPVGGRPVLMDQRRPGPTAGTRNYQRDAETSDPRAAASKTWTLTH